MHACTRFSERVFIQDKHTRSLLKEFCIKGITQLEWNELSDQLLPKFAPSIGLLFQHLKAEINISSLPLVSCPNMWSKFISALACPSPVCALVHPSDKVFTLLRKIVSEDITRDPISMQLLQQEIPVIFDLLNKNSGNLPRKCLTTIIEVMISKASAPFSAAEVEDSPDTSLNVEPVLQELAYFPSLPKVRSRGLYSADQHTTKGVKCTKQSSGHPSLLPGIFTLFCPHGKFPLFVHGIITLI